MVQVGFGGRQGVERVRSGHKGILGLFRAPQAANWAIPGNRLETRRRLRCRVADPAEEFAAPVARVGTERATLLPLLLWRTLEGRPLRRP